MPNDGRAWKKKTELWQKIVFLAFSPGVESWKEARHGQIDLKTESTMVACVKRKENGKVGFIINIMNKLEIIHDLAITS